MKKLSELTNEQFGTLAGGQPNRIQDPQLEKDLEITKVTADSRRVKPGALFVAIRGLNQDGHQFLPDAIRQGAVALVGEDPRPELTVPYFQVHNSRYALAHLAAAWYQFPARQLMMIGVTGTDGKTTTAKLIFQILQSAGIKPGLITSVHAQIGQSTLDTGLHVTTPDALEIQGLLAKMVDQGVTHCILEATSHGLAQHRVAACEFDLGVLTNLTHEHLDYHGTFEEYRDAKAMLFRSIPARSRKKGSFRTRAILNLDDASFEPILSVTDVPHTSYGLSRGADFQAARINASLDGLTFQVKFDDRAVEVHSPLLGEYNVMNGLAAIATTVAGLDISIGQATRGIASMQGVPGRMERVDMGQPFLAFVDFAHTPNSLRKVLLAGRSLARGRVIAIFGSAGLRDPQKRQLMAKVSAELADLTVLTAEDPRTESLEDILEEMVEGARSGGGVEGEDLICIPDRGDAIRWATQRADGGDIVLLCGKGHEQSMCFGEVEYAWDDRLALRSALAELMGLPGPEMPSLPTSSKSSVED